MKPSASTIHPLPLGVVGSSSFGQYPKISSEKTFNMLISDGFLVPYPGFKSIKNVNSGAEGRGIFSSARFQHMILVIGSNVYVVDANITVAKVGTMNTSAGDVFISENIAGQIAICDKLNMYIYNYLNNTFTMASLDFQPGYIEFQDSYFIAPVLQATPPPSAPTWRLSDSNTGNWSVSSANNTGTFQTKADIIQACVRFPGRGNLLYVMGSRVTELWQDIGGALFPYQRNSSINIDYGCANPATIASSENLICWLGINEKSGPFIMYSTGGDIQTISTDGINYLFSQLTQPRNAYGFLIKLFGHLIYQITFPADRLSLAYDFNTGKFFNLCDEDMDIHPAKRTTFFNNTYYFVSFNDGNLYELNPKYTNYQYSATDIKEIPRVRVCNTTRLPDNSPFIVNNVNLTIEQGNQDINTITPRVDISVSYDGGQSFSSYWGMQLNAAAHRQNRFIAWNLGYANEFIPQFRFWGFDRFVVGQGQINIYQ